MSDVRRQFSIAFTDGLPTISVLQRELETAAKVVPAWTAVSEIEDDHSANPELRQIALHFSWGTND